MQTNEPAPKRYFKVLDASGVAFGRIKNGMVLEYIQDEPDLHGVLLKQPENGVVTMDWSHVEEVPAPCPKCFGSNPSPQERAENDCFTCLHETQCQQPAPCPKRSKDIKEIALKVAQNIGLDRPSEFAAAAQMVVDWYIEQQKQTPCPRCDENIIRGAIYADRLALAEAELDEWRHGERRYAPLTADYKEVVAETWKLKAELAQRDEALKVARDALQDVCNRNWTYAQCEELQAITRGREALAAIDAARKE